MRKLLFILSLLVCLTADSQIYKLRLYSTHPRNYAADGVGNPVMHDTCYMIGGWNPDSVPVHGADSLFFRSVDSGKTWTRLADLPFYRHDFIYFVKNDKIFVAGGDGFNDSWCYTTASGWVNITNDMGSVFNSRNKPMWCYNPTDGYVYAVGGFGNDGHAMTDMIRSSDLVTWEVVATLPVELQGCNKGAMSFLNGSFFLMGGYLFGDIVSGDVWKINATTYSFTKIISDDPIFETYYCNSASTGQRIWFLRGRDTDNNNSQGVYWSADGLNWNRFEFQLSPGRHATGMFAWGQNIVFACGNLFNQFWMIKRIDN